MRKIEIAFNTEAYEMELNKVARKRELFLILVNTAKEFIPIPKEDYKKLKANPVKYFQDEILKAYEGVNAMKLSFDKLTMLLELDVNKYFKAVKAYQELTVDEDREIKKEDFIIYATTPEQIKLYEVLSEVCKPINKLKEEGFSIGTAYIQAAFCGALKLDSSLSKLSPNPYYILQR